MTQPQSRIKNPSGEILCSGKLLVNLNVCLKIVLQCVLLFSSVLDMVYNHLSKYNYTSLYKYNLFIQVSNIINYNNVTYRVFISYIYVGTFGTYVLHNYTGNT